MIFTIKKADRESKLKTDLVKNNLFEVCKWFNFIEDNGLAEFSDNHITMYITLDYHIDSPNCYMNNGVYFNSHGMAIGRKLPTRPTWDCYCLTLMAIMVIHLDVSMIMCVVSHITLEAQQQMLHTMLVRQKECGFYDDR